MKSLGEIKQKKEDDFLRPFDDIKLTAAGHGSAGSLMSSKYKEIFLALKSN